MSIVLSEIFNVSTDYLLTGKEDGRNGKRPSLLY